MCSRLVVLYLVAAILEMVAVLNYQQAYMFFFTIMPNGGSLPILTIVLPFDPC